MNPTTHLLASWTLAEGSRLKDRDRALCAWVGALPDLDGLGMIPDLALRLLGQNDPGLYGRYHHMLLHGLAGAIVLPAAAALMAQQKARVFLWGFAAVHLHLMCDLVGSRGQTPDDIWPIHYLAPFSDSPVLKWSHQWPLNGWPNILLTLGLLLFVIFRSVTEGHSPVSLFSQRAHKAFVGAVQSRWAGWRKN